MAAGRAEGMVTAGRDPVAAGLDPAFWNRGLFEAFLDGRAIAGGDVAAVEDQDRQPLTRDRLLLASAVLGRRLATMTARGERVGVLLPNVGGAAVTLLALTAYGRVPAMLNFSAGLLNLEAACVAAGIRTIVTSDAFVRTAKLDEVVAKLAERTTVIRLEEVRRALSLVDKAIGAAYSKLPRLFHAPFRPKPDDVAVVLFTSGTEGVPKGVALSHANLLANVAEIRAAWRFRPDDVMFNALPVFHSFGLTAGLLLPLVGGFKSFLYPSPLHYRQIPGFVKAAGTTILLATDTFAAGWGRAAEADDFATVKMTILGAERVKEATRRLWRERFGIELNEGYGATECAPVIAVNIPGSAREGTVGPLLPGIEARLEPVPGLSEGGRLLVRGPNLMRGYFRVDRPGVLQPREGEWYDTGDIVTIDADGFVAIRGRAKRFAKVGGEMVSLAAVEAYAAAIWPEASHAAVAVPDPRKGEAVVLVSDSAEASVEGLIAYAQDHGIGEIMMPRKVVKVDALPVLGTGKVDFLAIGEIAAKA